MAKYIDADLLRKEVKRLEKSAHKSALGCADSETRKFHEGKDFAYQHVGFLIGMLIDSLQQEQREVDLEEELDKFYGMYRKDGKTYDITDDEEVSDWKEDGNSWFKIEFARHFYELGKNSK